MLLFDREKDGEEYQKVSSRVEQDDTIDGSLVDVVDGRGSESSFSHRFMYLKRNNMSIICEFAYVVDNLCCFSMYIFLFYPPMYYKGVKLFAMGLVDIQRFVLYPLSRLGQRRAGKSLKINLLHRMSKAAGRGFVPCD